MVEVRDRIGLKNLKVLRLGMSWGHLSPHINKITRAKRVVITVF
jgi:hypothetical protein